MADLSKQPETILFGGPPPTPVPQDISAAHDVTTPPGVTMALGGAPDAGLPPLPPEPDLTGTLLLDRYRLLRKLGVGGMGTVYEAEHVTIKKRCAIKILNPEYAHRGELVERFLQEARAASMIAHENVVEITDFGATPTGSVFFVMEMLVGEDLAETIKRDGPLPWSRSAAITLQICRALQAAHDKGIIHRDMKPENCFRIERSGNPDFIKVLDFGIAKVTGEDTGAARLTSTGMIFGTPTYMSPEQAQGMRVDHRADIYAVGVILYELCTGKVPFYADNFMGILTKHMFEEPPAPSVVAPQADISPEIEAVILKAMQKDRDLRFQTLRELSDAILDVGTGAAPVDVIPERRSRPITGAQTQFQRPSTAPPLAPTTVETVAPRRRGLGTVLLALAAVAGGGWATALLMRDDPPPQPAPKDTPPVAVAAPDPPKPVEPPPPKPAEDPKPVEDPAPAGVRVIVATNAPAEVWDAAGATRLGATGDAGLQLAGAGPYDLLLRAAQFDDLKITIPAATDGQRFEYTLKAKKKGAGKATPVATKKNPGETKAGTPPDPTPPPDSTPTGTKFGLKDPFKKTTPP